MLAMTEKRMFENHLQVKLVDHDMCYNPVGFEDFKTFVTSGNICSQHVGALIQCQFKTSEMLKFNYKGQHSKLKIYKEQTTCYE